MIAEWISSFHPELQNFTERSLISELFGIDEAIDLRDRMVFQLRQHFASDFDSSHTLGCFTVLWKIVNRHCDSDCSVSLKREQEKQGSQYGFCHTTDLVPGTHRVTVIVQRVITS